MPFIKISDKMKDLDRLISNCSTGSPHELADKLSISPNVVLSLLDKLRESGSVIQFSKTRCSFYYKVRVPFFLDSSGMGKPVKPSRVSLRAGSYQRTCQEQESFWSDGQLS